MLEKTHPWAQLLLLAKPVGTWSTSAVSVDFEMREASGMAVLFRTAIFCNIAVASLYLPLL